MNLYNENLFKDKIVLVSGGGSGIGFITTRMFMDCGATVLICGRNLDKLESAIDKLDKPNQLSHFQCDIRESEQIKILAEFIRNKFGRLDILVNNAGGQFPSMAEDISEKGWKAVINNNLNGTWLMTQIMANEFFIPQKSGSIVNVTVNNFRGLPGMAHTGAARAGIENFSKTLAVEWAPHNIRVNCIAPGVIQSTGLENYPEEMTKGLSNKIPMKRLGTTNEVANAILFVAGELGSYITGETVYVDGGSRLWGDFWEIS
jgi:citronellol/citronellal dehydrogenase